MKLAGTRHHNNTDWKLLVKCIQLAESPLQFKDLFQHHIFGSILINFGAIPPSI